MPSRLQRSLWCLCGTHPRHLGPCRASLSYRRHLGGGGEGGRHKKGGESSSSCCYHHESQRSAHPQRYSERTTLGNICQGRHFQLIRRQRANCRRCPEHWDHMGEDVFLLCFHVTAMTFIFSTCNSARKSGSCHIIFVRRWSQRHFCSISVQQTSFLFPFAQDQYSPMGGGAGFI